MEIQMSLLEQIKTASLEARKARDVISATLLTTLLAEATNVGKNDGNRESTDAEVVAVVKKFIKGVDETMAHLEKLDGDHTKTTAIAVAEKSVLSQFVPTQLDEAQLQAVIDSLVAGLATRNAKQMGAVMKQLKEKYEGHYDGQLASKLIKTALA